MKRQCPIWNVLKNCLTQLLWCMNAPERTEMKNPFKVGQIVYHPVHGKCEIANIDPHSTSAAVYLKNMGWFPVGILSYEPWPAPVHSLPFVPVLQPGDWIRAITKSGMMSQLVEVIKEHEDSVETSYGKIEKASYNLFMVAKDPVKFN